MVNWGLCLLSYDPYRINVLSDVLGNTNDWHGTFCVQRSFKTMGTGMDVC